ncbi:MULTISPECIES: hypothetical protein [Vibrio]|uniref:hypothetical protein n=1 Tax=Vibrio TaxID=662 RepID=UPI001C5C89C3|nr:MULTISPECIES: hypothetical protein [Vibrio]MDA0120374.1 hypothetical protein [Vibrio sp. T11.5]QXX05874.1 hypothetical protein KW548_11990 [Vibrio neptunius]
MDNNLATAIRNYRNGLQTLPVVTNMNTGFKGYNFLNRTHGVNVAKLDNWIKELVSRGGVLADRPLATYTLPGAHDAMTFAYRGSFFTRNIATFVRGGTVTQTLNLASQFKAGIRYFDIRVKEKKGKIYGFHGGVTFDKVDARQEIRRLFILAACKKEPIVVKFVYKGNAFPIVKRIANDFGPQLMPTSDYWHKSVGECIRKGKVICLFHKAKDKHRLKWGNSVDTFGDYNQHKSGGTSNQHNLKRHEKYLDKLMNTSFSLDEEKLKVMSLNIPCVQTGGKNLARNSPGLLLEGLVVVATGSIIRPGTLIHHISNKLGVPQKNRWLGFYKSVKDTEKHAGVKAINKAFVGKLNALVDSWYYSIYQTGHGVRRAVPTADTITQKASGAVSMDYVGEKGQLILELIEVNNRDF